MYVYKHVAINLSDVRWETERKVSKKKLCFCHKTKKQRKFYSLPERYKQIWRVSSKGFETCIESFVSFRNICCFFIWCMLSAIYNMATHVLRILCQCICIICTNVFAFFSHHMSFGYIACEAVRSFHIRSELMHFPALNEWVTILLNSSAKYTLINPKCTRK
jgi:hypothetical protein